MLNQSRIIYYGTLFLLIFAIKMFVATAPVIFDFDKTLVNAAIMQLELENEANDAKDTTKDIDKIFKKGIDFINSYDRPFDYSLVSVFSGHHYLSKKYLNLYFPAVPTPPPNFS